MRVGAGFVTNMAGAFLSPSDEIYESVVMGVLTQRYERWGGVDFGTDFISSLEENITEGELKMRIEINRGVAREPIIVESITTSVVTDANGEQGLDAIIVARNADGTQAIIELP